MTTCRVLGLVPVFASLCVAAIEVEVSREACRESNQIGLRLINDQGNDRTQQARMVDIRRWFLDAEKSVEPGSFFKLLIKPPLRPPSPVVVTEVRIVTASPEDWTPDPRRFHTWKPPDMLEVCLDLADDLSPGDSKVTLSFEPVRPLPTELKPIVEGSVTGPATAAQPTDLRDDSNRPKRYERELDLMFVLLSSVKDRQESGVTVRSRDTSPPARDFIGQCIGNI